MSDIGLEQFCLDHSDVLQDLENFIDIPAQFSDTGSGLNWDPGYQQEFGQYHAMSTTNQQSWQQLDPAAPTQQPRLRHSAESAGALATLYTGPAQGGKQSNAANVTQSQNSCSVAGWRVGDLIDTVVVSGASPTFKLSVVKNAKKIPKPETVTSCTMVSGELVAQNKPVTIAKPVGCTVEAAPAEVRQPHVSLGNNLSRTEGVVVVEDRVPRPPAQVPRPPAQVSITPTTTPPAVAAAEHSQAAEPSAPNPKQILPSPISGESSFSFDGYLNSRKLTSATQKQFTRVFKSKHYSGAQADHAAMRVGNGALRALFLAYSDNENANRRALVDCHSKMKKLTADFQLTADALTEKKLETDRLRAENLTYKREAESANSMVTELGYSYDLNRAHDFIYCQLIERKCQEFQVANHSLETQLTELQQQFQFSQNDLHATRVGFNKLKTQNVFLTRLLDDCRVQSEKDKAEIALSNTNFCCETKSKNKESFEKLITEISTAFRSGTDGGVQPGESKAPAATAAARHPHGRGSQQAGAGGTRQGLKKRRLDGITTSSQSVKVVFHKDNQ